MKRRKSTYPFRNNKEIGRYNAKCFAEFRNECKDMVKEIPLNKIKMEEPIHINAKANIAKDIEYYITKEKKVTTPLIVKEVEDGYILLSGWKYYQLAYALSQNFVYAIVTEFDGRVALMKSIGCIAPLKVCKITELKVPSTFDCTVVNPEKLEAIKTYDYKYHAPMKPIVVNEDMLIVDGYAQYVYNRNMEKEYYEVRFAM